MNTTRNRRKLRNFLAYPGLQLRLALIHGMFVLVVNLVLALALLLPLYHDIFKSHDLWVQYATAELLLRLIARLGAAVLLIIGLSAIFHIIFSHRLCGPLVNINHTLDRLRRGDLTRKVILRRTDFLKWEAVKINDVLAGLNTRVSALKTTHADLEAIASEAPEGLLRDRLCVVLGQNQRLLDEWVVEPTPPNSEKTHGH